MWLTFWQPERKSSSESSESVVCQSNVISLVRGNWLVGFVVWLWDSSSVRQLWLVSFDPSVKLGRSGLFVLYWIDNSINNITFHFSERKDIEHVLLQSSPGWHRDVCSGQCCWFVKVFLEKLESSTCRKRVEKFKFKSNKYPLFTLGSVYSTKTSGAE